MKQVWKPGTMVYPVPAALVSCADRQGNTGLLTIAWTGTVCTNPPMLYISVRPERYSYGLIMDSGEFTLNLTTKDMVRATDWCGVKSGRDHDKWAESGLTPIPGVKVACPSVEESPLSIECRVREVIKLGTHDMILADVLSLIADDRYIDPKTGAFDLAKAGLTAWAHGKYYELGAALGHFGFSVRKKA